uniref:Double-stranded RNA-binding protein Staufen homolog 1 n=1 Tax=Takifugu rubripes TaxID=31033 RepID=A0A674PKV3_TAKRU
MSQLQYHCPASPMAAAPAPLPLGQPQPGYSIHCGSGTLPSESASQPVRSSALPAGSATPYTTTTVPNMANPKEKTPMCLVNELARFNKIQPEYKLLCEQGPAHSKIFSVRLTLGDQYWEAEGPSIKKAQHSAAASALIETTLPKPTMRTPRNTNRIPGGFLPCKSLLTHTGRSLRVSFNHFFVSLLQYYYPFPPVGPMLYHMELSVGGQQFIGKGRTRQLAKHDAAAKALKVLHKEPILQQVSVMNGEPEEENLNKSEISQVFEIALKRNLPVNFEVLKEEGPPHMKSFVVRVTVGEFTGEGEGKSKKIAKKLAAAAALGELKKLPHIPSVEKSLPRIKKKNKSIIKLQTSPEYGQGMNPISRLAQIQQAKKEKEPEYSMVTERGLPRRREFVMQVIWRQRENAVSITSSGFHAPLLCSKEEEARLPYLSHQQLPAGILPMVPEVAQAVGACQGSQPKDYSRAVPNPGKATVTAMIANELLYAGTSMTAESILKNKNINHLPHGPLTRPSEQLGYLAAVQGLQVEYKDFPKNNKNEFVSLINCSSQPPLISHGIGKDVESCHDMAALNVLKLLSELDLQSNERTGNGPVPRCGKQELEGELHLKQANSSTLTQTLDGTV